jgi:hypothetical protein
MLRVMYNNEKAISVIGIQDNQRPSSESINPRNENDSRTKIRNNTSESISVAIAMGSILLFLSLFYRHSFLSVSI